MHPELTKAWLHGSAPTNSNTVVNFGGGAAGFFNGAYLNLAKWLQFTCADADWLNKFSDPNGYPVGPSAFTAVPGSLMLWDPAYYGHHTLSWSGQAGLTIASGLPMIVYNGGNGSNVTVFNVSPSASGVSGNGLAIQGTSTSSAPSVEFAFGFLIGAVSTSGAGDFGGAGLVKFTTSGTNFLGNFNPPTTTKLKINFATGLPAGPNSDGSWTVNVIDSNNFSLQGSSAYAGLVSLNTSGTPNVNTEAIYAGTGNVQLFNATTFASFTNLVLAKTGDLPAINSGKLAGAGIVAALSATKASYIRFMDMIGVQNLQAISSFSDRVVPASFTWGTVSSPHGYYGGQLLTNTSDAFTCSNPSSSPVGAYLDGEVVIAQVPSSGQNTGYNPTLNVGARGAKPIYTDFASLLNWVMSSSVPPTGTIITIVFTGGGLSSAFTYHYTTSTSVNGPGGVLDTSLNNIAINIRADINGNVRGNSGALVTANISSQNGSIGGVGFSQMSFYYNQNINSSGSAQLGAGMSIAVSDNGGVTTHNVGLVNPGYLANSNYVTFTFSALLQGWIATPYGTNGGAVVGGVRGGPPLEFYEELCNRANAGMWYNFGITDSTALITATVTHIANSGVKGLVCEFSNETWNITASQWAVCQTMANALGLSAGGHNSFTGLRIIQMANAAQAAWVAAGRSRSQLKIANAYQFVDMNSSGTTNTANYRFNGNELTPGSNVTLAAYGGPAGGTATPTAWSTNSSVAPNRPVDWSDWVSPAPYWNGGQYNSGNGSASICVGTSCWFGFTGSAILSNYNGCLLAAYNYQYGTPTQQAAALDFLYSISGVSGDLYSGTLNSEVNVDFQIASWALGSGNAGAGYFGVGTVAASYDSSRSGTGTGGGAQLKLGVGCYEGGWVMGPIANTGDAGTVASNLTTLGYTNGYSSGLPGAAAGGPTGASDTATLAATNLALLLQAWKNDTRAQSLVSLSFSQFKSAVNTVSVRDAFPCWYGFEGPDDFALYPGLVSQSGPFQAVNALAAFN